MAQRAPAKRDRTRLHWFEASTGTWDKMRRVHRAWLKANYPKRILLNHLASQVLEDAVLALEEPNAEQKEA